MAPNLLHLSRPFLAIIPEVRQASRKVPLREQFLYTAIALLIFLVCSHLPLYGIAQSNNSDPFYWARAIMASSRGTCMELGISPLVTSGLLVQLMVGSKLIQHDPKSKEDRALMGGFQKLVAILITLGQASVYVISGMYGDLSDMGLVNAFLIVFQLVWAGIVVICLDELLQKGYGFGAGSTLFITVNICETIAWKMLSPMTFDIGHGTEFEGALVALFHLLIVRPSKLDAFYEAFFRPNLPNLSHLAATVFVFYAACYFQGIRVDLRVKSSKTRGFISSYPVKLFYTSNMPIVLQSALVSNFYFISQLLFKKFPANFLVQLVGTWKEMEPVWGLSKLLSPPNSLSAVVTGPLHALFYLAFMLLSCALFSLTWIEVSNMTARDVAKNIRDQGMQLVGFRDSSAAHYLQRYIPTAAAFGGMCIGALSMGADLLGAIGSGTGILMAVTNIHEYREIFKKEKMM